MTDKEIDHEYTREIVCPWCGHVHGDSWEAPDSSVDEKCDECGKPFTYYRDYTVTYISAKVEK